MSQPKKLVPLGAPSQRLQKTHPEFPDHKTRPEGVRCQSATSNPCGHFGSKRRKWTPKKERRGNVLRLPLHSWAISARQTRPNRVNDPKYRDARWQKRKTTSLTILAPRHYWISNQLLHRDHPRQRLQRSFDLRRNRPAIADVDRHILNNVVHWHRKRSDPHWSLGLDRVVLAIAL